MLKSVKSLGYVKRYSLPYPKFLKALANLPDANAKTFAVEPENPKPHWKSVKIPDFPKVINKLTIFKILKDFTNCRNKSYRTVVFTHRSI